MSEHTRRDAPTPLERFLDSGDIKPTTLDRVFFFLILLAMVGALFQLVGKVIAAPIGPQQLVYQSQATLPNGQRVGIFVPAKPVALGMQSKSGSRVLVIGDVLHCAPFTETQQIGDISVTTQLMNCGPPAPGQPDRILQIVGLQWAQ